MNISTRFEIKTNNKRVINAVLMADRLLDWDSELIAHIYSRVSWGFNSGSGEEVAKKLNQGLRKPVPVTAFTYWNPFSSMLGRFKNGTIQVNNNKLSGMTDIEILGNILHEYAHAVGFQHGDNYKTEEKCLYSVPYYLSENVGKWL